MKIVEAVEKLTEFDVDYTICAKRPWTAESECVVVELENEETEDPDFVDWVVPAAVKSAGFERFLEIDAVYRILETCRERTPTLDEKVRLVLFYAEHGDFPDWALS